MAKEINLSKKEWEILDKALVEYEKNHYESEDDKWQDIVNSLQDKIREEIK